MQLNMLAMKGFLRSVTNNTHGDYVLDRELLSSRELSGILMLPTSSYVDHLTMLFSVINLSCMNNRNAFKYLNACYATYTHQL